MANITEAFQPKADTDAQRELFRNVMSMNNSFWNTMAEIYKTNDSDKSLRYYACERNFNNNYNVYTKQYRELYHHTTHSAVGLYNKQFNKKSMLDQLLTVHSDYQVVEVNRYKKLRYNYLRFWELMKEQMNLMFAIYGTALTILQIQTSISKLMIDYFMPDDVNWLEAADVVNQFMTTANTYENMVYGAQFYGTKPVKHRNTGMTYKTKNTGVEYTVKMLLDQGLKKTEICRELNMPRRTLYNIINKFNLDKPVTL